MAATAFDGLADVYTLITPSLPTLYKWELPVTANRPALPYALLIQSHGADRLQVQRNPSASGNRGIRNEIVWCRFFIWGKVPEDTDSAASILTAALYPMSVVVTGAKTVTQVIDTMVSESRRRPPRAQGRPIPRGSEVDTDRVYAANVDVKVRVAYT